MSDERPDALLKSALEKIVYFEARADQLHGELDAARQEVARLQRELAATGQREIVLRRELAEFEVRVHRAHSEREELSRLNQALRDERTQLLGKLLDATRIRTASQAPETPEDDDDLGIDLASFISQLRSEALNRPTPPTPEGPAPRGTPPPAPPVARSGVRERPPPPVPDEDEPLWSVPVPAVALAVAAVPTVAMGASVGAPVSASAVVQQAQRFRHEGRLGVSPEQLAELSGYVGPAGRSGETLFGFSVRELSAADPAARIRAAERLKALGQTAAAPALATALHAETDPSAQVGLLQAFAGLCREQGASVVSPLLASPVAEVRIAALKALLSLAPKDAAPHLAQAMKDPDRAVRRRASLLALGLEGEAAHRLGEEAIHDTDPEVRSLAALALGAGSGEGARTLLLDALLDADRRVRRSASQSLSRILGQDVSAVVELDEPQRRREIRRLSLLPAHPVRTPLVVRPPPAPTPAPEPVAVRASVARPAPVREAPTPAPERAAPVRAALAVMGSGPQAPSAPRPAEQRARPSPVEALCAPLMEDIRTAIRGRSFGELASMLSAPVELAQEALTLLVARGAVVRRGHKYFAA
ncbi:HEAT repeat domain-containing protein [Stigmatella sp. ncwal1]|uniref:HEAT repeat domain-containing protein n=1 Tax=Stigmatella ashevillensis TaxID=2995309 RepID=A0ABT5DBM3_9BACT|nr:HEAT repeat domain-containing protein [Stigmatella ashevillena]MDC0711038.1 HEAT repeat domain-containing protein [Stigmatella ashevillena]